MTLTPGDDENGPAPDRPANPYDPPGAYPYPPPPTGGEIHHVYAAAPVAVRPSNGVATAGGVCGIVAAAISWVPLINVFALVLSIIAVAFGAVGLRRANAYARDGYGPVGRGMAITGIVIGVIGLIFALIFIVAIGSAINDISRNIPTTTS